MDSERWKQVDNLLQSALRAPADRDGFLRQACAGDDALENEVRSLVAVEQRAGAFLENPAMEVAAHAIALRQSDETSESLAGRTVSHYRIVEKLGAGGMGVVWRARDTRPDRFVALKFLPAAKMSDPERKRRFVREAKAASALNHPNIITIYDIGQAGPEGHAVDFIAMECVEGRTLGDLIRRKGLKLSEALKYAVEIADALAQAHAAGIIHRDIKPGNVMVSAEGRVKVLDFGLAKLTEASPSSPEDPTMTERQSTEVGMIVGTVSYMSPEQAEGRKLDGRSDIFSFGSLLCEMLTGRRAFRGEAWATAMAAVLHQEPEPFEAPPDLERAVRRCLGKSPAARFQTATELKAALEAIDIAAERLPSIAVLPFANMSGDKDQEYFSDGLAEEILNALAQIPSLKVIARTSSFVFKGQNMDVRRIASELGVTNILEGSVRRAGDRVRVTAQLIAARDGSHLWSHRYDRLLADVFAIQDELAEAIATALQSRLATDVKRPQRYAPKLPAYELFLKAMHHYAKYSRESAFRCQDYLEQVLALDSDFALAHAMLGECFIKFAVYSSMPAREAAARARSFAQRALDLDPSVSEAREVLARAAAALDYDWKECDREFQLAMSREPISPRLRCSYAHNCLLSTGQLKECERELNRALEDDPINALSRFSLALCLHSAGRLDEAEDQFRQVLELDAHFVPAAYWLVRNHAAKGALAEALALAETLLPLAPLNPEVVGGLAGLLRRAGKRKRADELLDRLGDGTVYGAPLGFLSYYFLQGKSEQAAEWMGKAIDERHVLVPLYVRTPLARSLLESSDWPPLAIKMNLGGVRYGAARRRASQWPPKVNTRDAGNDVYHAPSSHGQYRG